jgi:putative aminopeptidase FrvX
MTPESLTFLRSLLEADVSGNSFATLNTEGTPRLMLAGHIDEIGIMVTHIDDD